MLSATKKTKQSEMIGNDSVLLGWSGRASLRRGHWSWGLADWHLLPLSPPWGCFGHLRLLSLSILHTFLPPCFWSTFLFLWTASVSRPSSWSASPREMDSAARNNSSLLPAPRLCHWEYSRAVFCLLFYASISSSSLRLLTHLSLYCRLLHSARHVECLWSWFQYKTTRNDYLILWGACIMHHVLKVACA